MCRRTDVLKETYRMKQHVEGGYFAEVYTASAACGGRPLAGSIYYLLDAGDVCVFHQLDCDEIYYYHEGCGMKITVLSDGEKREYLLGGGVEAGACACVILPKGCVFAAENRERGGYTLVSCMTAPQFEESGCRLIGKDELRERFPAYADALAYLAR